MRKSSNVKTPVLCTVMRTPPRVALAALLIVLAIGLALAFSLNNSPTHKLESPPGVGAIAARSGFEGAAIAGRAPQNFTLTDQRGRRVSRSGYQGRVVVLAFLSTAGASARISRLMAQQVRGALEELETPAVALAVSTDPRTDTRVRVDAFLNRVGLRRRLSYLTGSASQLRSVWRAYQIIPPLPHAHGPDRSAYVILLDRRGVQRIRFYVEQLTPEALAHDIRKLQAE